MTCNTGMTFYLFPDRTMSNSVPW